MTYRLHQYVIVELTDSFNPFLEDGFYLNAEWGTSQTFGTTVQFSVSEKKEPPRYSEELEDFPSLAQNVGIAYQGKMILKRISGVNMKINCIYTKPMI